MTQPGWYQAENDPIGRLRWFDGTTWTHDTRTEPAAEQAAAWPAAFTSATASVARTSFMRRHAPRSASAPAELWLVSIAMLLAGALLLYPAIRYGYLGIELMFDGGELGRAFGALILMVLSIVAATGIALLLLAVGLLRGSRVAQLLTFVVCGITALSILLIAGDDLIGGATTGIVLLILVGVCAAVALRPGVRAFFARDERPMGVAVAATANAYFGWVLVLDGILFLLAATVVGRFAVAGLLMLAAAAVLIRTAGPLRDGDRAARTRTLAAYAAIAVGLIVLMSAGGASASIIVPFAAIAAGTVGLTVPESSKAHFGDRTTSSSPLAEL